jgi:maleate isomerase
VITIGIITPHAAAGADVELADLAGDQVTTRVARIAGGEGGEPPTSAAGLRALTRPELLDSAVSRIEPESLDALAYASTSTPYAIGAAAERDLVAQLGERWSLPVCSSSASAVEALRSLGVRRLALVHPPWFGADRSALGAAYFEGQGFTVAQSELADVPAEPDLVEPHHVVEWGSSQINPDVDAVFLGGNGFRAARAVVTLEERLGCRVLEANQVLLWSVLVETGAPLELRGCGSLLDALASAGAPHPRYDVRRTVRE